MHAQTDYETPRIVHEGDLEIQAGSPLGIEDPFDLELSDGL
jgi:hypothetical protein